MDRLFCDSLSRNVAFKCFMFAPEISNRMVFVNGKHPKLWTLKYGSKSIQTSLMLRKRPPKPYKLLELFYQFGDNCKILSCTFYLKEDEMKIALFAHFNEYHGNHN